MTESSKPQPRNSWSGETAQELLPWGDKEPWHPTRRIKRASPHPSGAPGFQTSLLETLLSLGAAFFTFSSWQINVSYFHLAGLFYL
jgi:hypothetical protein